MKEGVLVVGARAAEAMGNAQRQSESAGGARSLGTVVSGAGESSSVPANESGSKSKLSSLGRRAGAELGSARGQAEVLEDLAHGGELGDVGLGSASPGLVKAVSESLAGRVEQVELSGFDLTEVNSSELDQLWLRGGFPRSFLTASEADSGLARRVHPDIPRA